MGTKLQLTFHQEKSYENECNKYEKTKVLVFKVISKHHRKIKG